jgi:formamidopyrimidine-DNA glycosylase
MPELPEVETVVRLIRPPLAGRKITGAQVYWERTLGGLTEGEFERSVRGRHVARVWRRAKQIVIDLEYRGRPAGHLLVHLRMTGRLHVHDRSVDQGPYVRVSLPLDKGVLHFIDVRKFGRMLFREDPSEIFDALGPEPLEDGFTPEGFHAALRARRRVLKPLLLDQAFLAGLGNIYVDEALHRAGLHPLRRSDRISKAASRRLHGEIRATLLEAIEREGSSFDTFYRTPEGQPGSYQHQFLVYGRGGKPCRACGRTIRKLVVGQRGTHVCTRCQPAPRSV